METADAAVADGVAATTAAAVVDNKNNANRKKCFSSVQLRRVWAPLSESTVALCPSMDLVTFSLLQGHGQQQHQPHSQQQHQPPQLGTYRTLTFQKLSTITVDETTSVGTGNNKMNNDATTDNNNSPTLQQQQIQAAVWRPDGRWLAIVTHDPTSSSHLNLTLFHVEEMVSSGTLSTGNIDTIPQTTTTTSDGSSSSTATGAVAGIGGGGALSLSESNFPQLIGMSGNLVRIPITSSSSAAATGTDAMSTSTSCSTATVAHQVLGISWSHVGRWHPNLEDQDENHNMQHHFYWKFRSKYVDRAASLLPPSDYHREHYGGLGGAASAAAGAASSGGGGGSGSATRQHHQTSHGGGDGVLPNSNTPLSLLAVATNKGTVDCFLHGRYLIARDLPFDLIPCNSNGSSGGGNGVGRVTMVSSNDLVHLVLYSQGSRKISMYSLPAIGREHYNLQTITALYASIMGHLYALPSSITQVAESWKSSLKPLDRMMEGLVRLLQNYGLISSTVISDTGADTYKEQSTIRAHLVQYILSGHTMRAADLSNAMDQFFTGVQMNDQLLTRMERSLTVAVANVESLLRKAVAAGQALVLETTELVGLGRFAPNLLEPAIAQRLQEHAQVLFVTLESALTCIIDARFRLRDFVAWLRATGSQIKARGTAVNSVQRENARKRRVPDATVQRILRYLQGDDNNNIDEPFAPSKKNLSEALLGLNVTEHWETSFSSLDGSPPTVKLGRPPSPRSVHSTVAGAAATSPFATLCVKSIPTIPFALSKTLEAAHVLFTHPRVYISKSIRRTDLCLPTINNINNNDNLQTLPVALTTRLGAGGLSEEGLAYGEEPPTGFFAPKMADSSAGTQQRDGRLFRQWTLVAQTMDPPPHQNKQEEAGSVVCMYALPIPARGASTLDYDDNDDDDDDYYSNAENDDDTASLQRNSFVLSTTFSFPAGYRVCDLAFYGDNGKSSLFSGVDGGCGKERRQALGALVVCPAKKDNESLSASLAAAAATENDVLSYGLEVWLIDYERSTWTDYDLNKQQCDGTNNQNNKGEANVTAVYALPAQCDYSKIHKVLPMPRGMDREEGSNNNNNNENDNVIMQDDDDDEDNNKEQQRGVVLYARTRETGRVDSLAVATSSRFLVSGSRGMGVVMTNQPGGTLLEVLDMEEDEDVDDDDDDNEDDDNQGGDDDDDEGDEQMQNDDDEQGDSFDA